MTTSSPLIIDVESEAAEVPSLPVPETVIVFEPNAETVKVSPSATDLPELILSKLIFLAVEITTAPSTPSPPSTAALTGNENRKAKITATRKI